MELVEAREMVYVLSVWEERSFSRAAERCYISQPALSKIVKRVEGKMGVRIFDRNSSPLRLTRDGEQIIEYIRGMRGTYQKMEAYCEEMTRHQRCDISIGAPSFFCTYVLPPLAAAFKEDNPQVSVKLIEINDADLRELLKNGAVDIGLSVESNMPLGLNSFVLQEEHIILAVPSAFAVNRELEKYAISWEELRDGRGRDCTIPPVPMERFAGENFLLLKQGNDMRKRGIRICRDAGFVPNIVMEMDQLLSAYRLAEAGAGIAFIRASIPYYVGNENLIFYKIDHPDTFRNVRAYYWEERCTDMHKIFIEYLKTSVIPG